MTTAPAPRVAVFVPAYNEAPRVGNVLASLVAAGHAIVVVDDGSHDDTAAIARRFPVHLVRHPCNLGAGAALRTAIDYIATRDLADVIVTCDADGQHDPGDIARLVQPIATGGADIALGTRFGGIEAESMPMLRRLLLRAAVAFTRVVTGLPLTDSHNGFRAMTVAAARALDLRLNRMAHASELEGRIAALGLRWVEVPVHVRYTPYSVGKGQRTLDALAVLIDLAAARLR